MYLLSYKLIIEFRHFVDFFFSLSYMELCCSIFSSFCSGVSEFGSCFDKCLMLEFPVESCKGTDEHCWSCISSKLKH